MAYAFVTTKDFAGRKGRVRLKITSDTDKYLVGVQVDLQGDEVVGKGFDERRHIIDKSTIVSRTDMVMSRHYGQLEDVTGKQGESNGL